MCFGGMTLSYRYTVDLERVWGMNEYKTAWFLGGALYPFGKIVVPTLVRVQTQEERLFEEVTSHCCWWRWEVLAAHPQDAGVGRKIHSQ